MSDSGLPDAFLEMDTTRWPLTDGCTIGRATDNDIRFDLSALSRQHARLDRRPTGWFVVDLRSHNGTFVNGESIPSDGRRLDDGDELVLGGVVRLRFIDVMATPWAPRIGRLHGLWIDPETGDTWLDARRVDPPLSERQLALVRVLHDADGRVVSRDDIVGHVWPDVDPAGVSDQAIDALVKRVRMRLADYESGPPLVEVVRARGVRLRTNSKPRP